MSSSDAFSSASTRPVEATATATSIGSAFLLFADVLEPNAFGSAEIELVGLAFPRQPSDVPRAQTVDLTTPRSASLPTSPRDRNRSRDLVANPARATAPLYRPSSGQRQRHRALDQALGGRHIDRPHLGHAGDRP